MTGRVFIVGVGLILKISSALNRITLVQLWLSLSKITAIPARFWQRLRVSLPKIKSARAKLCGQKRVMAYRSVCMQHVMKPMRPLLSPSGLPVAFAVRSMAIVILRCSTVPMPRVMLLSGPSTSALYRCRLWGVCAFSTARLLKTLWPTCDFATNHVMQPALCGLLMCQPGVLAPQA